MMNLNDTRNEFFERIDNFDQWVGEVWDCIQSQEDVDFYKFEELRDSLSSAEELLGDVEELVGENSDTYQYLLECLAQREAELDRIKDQLSGW